MIPVAYRPYAYLALAAVIFATGFGLRGVFAERDEARTELATYKDHVKFIDERDKKFSETQAKLSALETRYTQEMNDAVAANSTLRDDLAVAQRMRLKGTSCPARPAAGAAPTGGADGVQVELSEATRRLVFDLRESIVRDQQVIAGLKAELEAREGVGSRLPPPNEG